MGPLTVSWCTVQLSDQCTQWPRVSCILCIGHSDGQLVNCTIIWPMYPVTCGELYLVHWVFQRSAGVLYYYLSIVHHDLWCTLCMGLPTVSWCTVLLVLSDHCTQWPLVYCSLCMGFPTVSWCTVLLSDHCTQWPLVYLVHGFADGQLVNGHLTVLVCQLFYLVSWTLEQLLQQMSYNISF